MPTLTINTNVPDKDIPDSLIEELVDVVATTLGKPKGYVVVVINGGVRMNWGGSTAPCANGTLMSIGALGEGPNKKASAAIMKKVKDVIGVPDDRFYLTFVDEKKENVGWRSTTFADFL